MHELLDVVRRWRWPLIGGALAAVMAVSILVVANGDDRQDVAATATTTTPATTTPAPEVLGDEVERPTSTTSDTTTAETTVPAADDVTATTTAATTATTRAVVTTTTTTAPVTTTTICRNSIDPSCGPLRWDPAPQDQAPTATETATSTTATVGEPVHLALVLDDPDGGAGGGVCEDWSSSDPGVVATGSCSDIPQDCPRYGPHDPPPPTPAQTVHETTVRFTTVGEQTVTVTGFTPDTLDDGCPNPYSSPWSHTFRVTVVPS